MPECAPVSTHPGQEGLREAGSGAKTGLEEPHGQRSPVTCLALDAKRALCSPSLGVACVRIAVVLAGRGFQCSPPYLLRSDLEPSFELEHVWEVPGSARLVVSGRVVADWRCPPGRHARLLSRRHDARGRLPT